MADYHKPVPPEALKNYAREHLDHEDRVTVDVLTLFGEADRMRGTYNSRQVPRKLTLEELEDPRQREE